MKTHKKRLSSAIIIVWYNLTGLLAQSPTHIDTRKSEPQPFTLDDIFVYIVFPVLLFIAAFWVRRYQKKKKEQTGTMEN